MKKLAILILLIMAVGVGLASAQLATSAQVITIDPFEKKDPALDELISPNARLEVLGTEFGFAEGPTWVPEPPNGFVVFIDAAANVLYKWAPYERKFSLYYDRPGYTGYDWWRVGMAQTNGREMFFMPGPMGITLDQQGRIVIAGWASRNVKRIEKDGTQTILADRYEGKRLSGPNDIVVKKNGTIYFTDSTGGMRLSANDPGRELMFTGAYMLKGGKVTLIGELTGSNGIALSPDEKYLYVSSGPGKTIWRYEVQPDDTAINGKLFIDLSADQRAGITDGMRVDARGNIWTSCCGGIHIFTPEGKELGMFRTPLAVGNLCFGDQDYKMLYIFARSDEYRIRTLVGGIPGR